MRFFLNIVSGTQALQNRIVATTEGITLAVFMSTSDLVLVYFEEGV